MAVWTISVFKYFCHQKPERSFHFGNFQFPVCARCTGFYISIITYLIVAMFIPINYSFALIITAFLLLIPAGVDGITQFFELRESNNLLRFLTGILGGIGLMIIVKSIKFMIIY